MPQLIDELVVSLGLDPTDFDEAQLRALEGLRRFQQQAERTSQQLQQNTGARLKGFFNALENPIQAARRGLFDLAVQGLSTGRQVSTGAGKASEGLDNLESSGRRSGESVGAGATAASRGLGVMAAAALTAFAALKGIQKVMGEIRDTAQDTETLGFKARWAGVPVEWMSRLANAAFVETGAPVPATEDWLVGLRGAVEAYRTPGLPTSGQLTGPLRTLANFGIPFLPDLQNQNLSSEQITQKITEAIANKMAEIARTQGLPAAMQFGQQVGMPQLLSQFMAGGWQQIQQSMARVDASTKEQTEELHRVEESERRLVTALDQLWISVETVLAPAIVALNNAFTGAIHWFERMLGLTGPGQGTPEDTQPKQGESWGEWSKRTGKPIPEYTIAGPLKRVLPWLFPDFKGAPDPGDVPYPEGRPGEGAGTPGERARGGEIPQSDLAPGGRVQRALAYFRSQGWTREQAAGIVGRLYAESGGLDPRAHNDVAGGHTGIAQWDQERWARYLAQLPPGADPYDFDSQLRFVQRELTHGEAAAGDVVRSQDTGYGAGMAMEGYERAGDPNFTRYAARLGQQLSGIQISPSGGISSTTTDNSRTTNNGGDVNVGPVVVHGNSDPYAVGGAVADAIKREKLVTNMNTGQE